MKFLAALLLSSASMAHADDWRGPDKAKHLQVSFAAGLLASLPTNDAGKAFALAMAPGLLKELHDARRGGSGFSGKDLAADALGAGLGVAVGRSLRLRVTPKSFVVSGEFK